MNNFSSFISVVRARIQGLVALPSDANVTHILRLDNRIKVFKMPQVGRSMQSIGFRVLCDCPIMKAGITQGEGAGRWLIMGKLSADGTTVQVCSIMAFIRYTLPNQTQIHILNLTLSI